MASQWKILFHRILLSSDLLDEFLMIKPYVLLVTYFPKLQTRLSFEGSGTSI